MKKLTPWEIIGLWMQDMAKVCDARGAQLLRASAEPEAHLESADHWFKAEEVAQIMGVSTDFIYRNKDKYPFTVREGTNVRFSKLGLDAYLLEQRGRGAVRRLPVGDADATPHAGASEGEAEPPALGRDTRRRA
jgi:hypothetical protein